MIGGESYRRDPDDEQSGDIGASEDQTGSAANMAAAPPTGDGELPTEAPIQPFPNQRPAAPTPGDMAPPRNHPAIPSPRVARGNAPRVPIPVALGPLNMSTFGVVPPPGPGSNSRQ